MNTEGTYINLLTDFGFKRIFGDKELLIDFLNVVFDGVQVVKDLTYLYTRKAGFIVYCESENEERFIVELESIFQKSFSDHTVYFSSSPIRGQDFNISRVYYIGFVIFNLRDGALEIPNNIKLRESETNRVFYKHLDVFFVEVAKFNKTENELLTLYDKWLYVLKNSRNLDSRPKVLSEEGLDRLFKKAELATFTPDEKRDYISCCYAYSDLKNCFDTAIREGRKEGLREGLREGFEKVSIDVARQLKAEGISIAQISRITGLSEEKIEEL